MTENPPGPGFWQTGTGVLTAVAGLLTAVGGLLALFIQLGIIGSGEPAPAPAAQPTGPSASSGPATAAAPVGKPWTQAQAKWTLNNGGIKTTRAETVRFCISAGAGVNIDDSQDVAFEKMMSIEITRSDVALSAGGRADVHITLVGGKPIDGTITAGCDFIGFDDVGRFNYYPDKLAKIEFIR